MLTSNTERFRPMTYSSYVWAPNPEKITASKAIDRLLDLNSLLVSFRGNAAGLSLTRAANIGGEVEKLAGRSY